MNPAFSATKYRSEDLEPLIGYSQMLKIGAEDPAAPPQIKKRLSEPVDDGKDQG